MSTLLMHNIEPFFSSTVSGSDHLMFTNTSAAFNDLPFSDHFESIDSTTHISTGIGNTTATTESPLITIDSLNNLNYHSLENVANINNTGGQLNYDQLLQYNNTTNNSTANSNFCPNDSTPLHLKYIDNQHYIVVTDNNCHDNNNNNQDNLGEHTGAGLQCVLNANNSTVDHYQVTNSWLLKSPEQWLPSEVAEWIRYWAQQNDIHDIDVAHLLYNQMSGLELCQMQLEYFTTVCPQYGHLIFESLQLLLVQFKTNSNNNSNNNDNDNDSNNNNNNNNNDTTTTSTTCFISVNGTFPQQTIPTSNNNNSNDNQNNSSSTNHRESSTSNDSFLSLIDLYSNHHSELISTNDLFDTHLSVISPNNSGNHQNHHSHNINQHQHISHNHSQHKHSPIYTNDSDIESTSSTNEHLQQQQNISICSFYSSPQSVSSVMSGNNSNNYHNKHSHQHRHDDGSSMILNEHIDLISFHTGSNNNNSSNNNNNCALSLKHHRSSNTMGRRGRPPKKDNKSRNKGNGKLWEFIRDLLLNPMTNPSLIRWERQEDGIFKFIQSDKVAKMWGERKQNPRMTYEKLSRAMRYYYKSQVLLPVFGRRLVYKFGPNATGWRPEFTNINDNNYSPLF